MELKYRSKNLIRTPGAVAWSIWINLYKNKQIDQFAITQDLVGLRNYFTTVVLHRRSCFSSAPQRLYDYAGRAKAIETFSKLRGFIYSIYKAGGNYQEIIEEEEDGT